MKRDLEEGVSNGESVLKYLESIEAGKFLSPEGKEYLFESFMTWDEAYAPRCAQEFCLENDITEDPLIDNWENNVGDEGMQNIMME